jgi:mannan endo-1,6-alpha-mannosidase
MVEYYYYTGDPTYNDVTTAGLQAQVGANKDYEPANVTKQLVCP